MKVFYCVGYWVCNLYGSINSVIGLMLLFSSVCDFIDYLIKCINIYLIWS